MNLPITSAAVLAALLLAPQARADKIYFGTAEQAEKLQEGSQDVIEGVITNETDEVYEIRVEGGTVEVAKSLVWKVEKDDLTVAQIEDRERASQERLVAANQQRRAMLAAEASARREAIAAEASMRREQGPQELHVDVDFQGLLPNYRFKVFDPVIGRVDLIGLQQLIRDYLADEVYRAAHRFPGR